MTEHDFRPDADGLSQALARLIAAKESTGSPHISDPAPLDLPTELPAIGLGSSEALNRLADLALSDATRLDHPGFFAHMDPPTPWLTWATATWSAAMNQNLLQPDSAPTARQLEPLVIDWLAPAFGMSGGHLTPGSSAANLTALWAARDLTGARRIVASEVAHISVPKAAHILGLDYQAVPVDDEQRLLVDELPDLSDTILVLTAGTTVTGSIDPLEAGQDAAWRHVDAAWAGPIRLSSHADVLTGIDDVDSVALSAHKWLYQPKESALVLFQDVERAHDALSFGAGYLPVPNVGILGSHGNTALSLAATLLAWGRDGLQQRIDADLALAQQLADLVTAAPDLELRQQPTTGVVNWRPIGLDPASVRNHLTGAWVSLATIAGQPWFRSVAANPLADPELLVAEVSAAIRRSGA